MKKKAIYGIAYGLLLVVTLIGFSVAHNAVVTEDLPIWEALNIWTLIPPLVAITLAFLTKNVIISLFLGIMSGTIMVSLVGGGRV